VKRELLLAAAAFAFLDPAPLPPSAAHRRGDATGEFSVRHPESFELTYKLVEETQ
jgi:hypothetical protein